jgi:antitoxin component YwqK of YwqJK toxin-antitoxin module
MLSFNSYGLFEKTVCVKTDAQERNNLIYLPNKTKPFSGNNLCKYNNGQIKYKGKYKNGMKDGKHIYWNENGQLGSEKVFINGKRKDGHYISYDEKGDRRYEDTWKNGKLNGLTVIHNVGGVSEEFIFKDGECIKGKCWAIGPAE